MYTSAGNVPSVQVMKLAINGAVNVVNLYELGYQFARFNIDAVPTSGAVNSVMFSNGRSEASTPLAYCGNNGAVFNTCSDLVVGPPITVTVTPYPLTGQQGTPYPSVSAIIQIIKGTPPMPTRSPISMQPTNPVPVNGCRLPQVRATRDGWSSSLAP